MKGINHRVLLQNWDAVLHKICNECSVHDVLGIIVDNLKNDIKNAELVSPQSQLCDNLKSALNRILEAMILLDPEKD